MNRDYKAEYVHRKSKKVKFSFEIDREKWESLTAEEQQTRRDKAKNELIKKGCIMMFEYIDTNKQPAFCDIERHGADIIVVTGSYKAANITNNIHIIATKYCNEHSITFDKVKVIERYDYRSYEAGAVPFMGIPNYSIAKMEQSKKHKKPRFNPPKAWDFIDEDKFIKLITIAEVKALRI